MIIDSDSVRFASSRVFGPSRDPPTACSAMILCDFVKNDILVVWSPDHRLEVLFVMP